MEKRSQIIALRIRVVTLAALLAAGCARGDEPSPTRIIPTRMPTIAVAPASNPTPESDSGWVAADPGIELRTLQVADIVPGAMTPVHVLRLDPAAVRLRVIYDPGAPRPLRSWVMAQRPLAAVNGGFFTADHTATALLVSDGTAHGAPYVGFGGMLATSPDGRIWMQPLRDEPYDPSVPLDQAIQSFPMLVYPGGIAADIAEDGLRARRSVAALDRAGRLLLIVCPTSAFTLHALASWLATSDLEIERALNLDGGSSTGMFVQADGALLQIDSFAALPVVLLVERRSG